MLLDVVVREAGAISHLRPTAKKDPYARLDVNALQGV